MRSRTHGEENPTKTKAASGIIRLKPHIVTILREIQPLWVDNDAYVFLKKLGKPVSANARISITTLEKHYGIYMERALENATKVQTIQRKIRSLRYY